VTSREDEERLVRALIARGGKFDQRTRQTARSRSS
jgi:hypothetical protein